MLICVYIRFIKRFYRIVYAYVFLCRIFSFVFLLFSDFNTFDVLYSWRVSGASRPLSFV